MKKAVFKIYATLKLKRPVPEFLFNKVAGLRPAILSKIDFVTEFSQLISKNF